MTSDERPAAPADHPAGTEGPATTSGAEAGAGPDVAPSVDVASEPHEPAAATTTSSGASTAAPAPAAAPAPGTAPGTAPTPGPPPDEAILADIAEPAQLRRAPKISAFITTGVLVGAVVGWLLAVLGSGTTGEARTGAILLTSAGVAALGAILGSGLAAVADRRSVRRRPGAGAGR